MKYNCFFKTRLLSIIWITLGILLSGGINKVQANCPEPTNFNVEINGNDAALSWDPALGAIGYEVGYFNQNDGSTGTANTTNLSYTFLNLPPGVYQFWVRSECEEGYSRYIIDVEEIDGALIEYYNCLCEGYFETEINEEGYNIDGEWNIADMPCKTEYRLNTFTQKYNGEQKNSTTTFSYDPTTNTALVNDCIEECLAMIDLSTTNKYNARDEQNDLLYSLVFEAGHWRVEWSEENIEFFTFDMSNCVWCENNAETNSKDSNSDFDLNVDVEFMQIQPNPFIDDLLIEWMQITEGSVSFKIYNASGQLMNESLNHYSKGKQRTRLEVSNWMAGIYFVVLQTNDLKWESKIVKIR